MSFRVNTRIYNTENISVTEPTINLLQTSVNDCLSYDYKTGEWQYGPSKNPIPPQEKPVQPPIQPVQPILPIQPSQPQLPIQHRIKKKTIGKLI